MSEICNNCGHGHATLESCETWIADNQMCTCTSFTARPDEPTELHIRFASKFVLGDGANERILQLQARDFTAICEWFEAELQAERTRREEAERIIKRLGDAWGESWDCSHDPGHEIFAMALTLVDEYEFKYPAQDSATRET